MHPSSQLLVAINLASHLHRDQVRRDAQKTPYVSHLFSVMTILSSVTTDEDVLIAGLMHDSLEDVPGYTYERLVEDCGSRVADIVSHVTEPLDANKEPGDQLPWLTRKEKYIEVLKSGSTESVLVSLADKIHNSESMILGIEEEGDEYLKRFFGSLSNTVWFLKEVLLVAKEKVGVNNPLYLRLLRSVTTLETFNHN